jgi:hypothetical protein
LQGTIIGALDEHDRDDHCSDRSAEELDVRLLAMTADAFDRLWPI